MHLVLATALVGSLLLFGITCATPALVEISDEANFNSMTNPAVVPRLTMLMWYTDWCQTCNAFARAYGQVASKYDLRAEEIMIARINVGNFEALGRKNKIEKFPTFLLYGPGFEKPIPYHGDYDPEEMIEWLEKQLKLEKKRKEAREQAEKK